jgi:hypothetical protein
MRVADVLAELLAALATTGVRTPPRWGDRPAGGPMGLVDLPTKIIFDAGGRGFDRFPDVAVLVLGGSPTVPESFRALAPYADGTGASSVKAALEAYPFTACGAVRVADAVPEVVTLDGIDHLAWVFHVDVTGRR